MTEDVEVTLPEEKEAVVVDEAPKVPVVEPEEGIENMKRKLQQAEAMRAEAERRAHEASQAANQAKAEVSDANYQMVKGAIKTLEGRAEQLKSAYAEALAVGDHGKAAEVQEAIAKAANQLSQLEQGKKAMKQELKKAEKFAKEQKKIAQRPQIAPVDQLASQVSPASANWLRQNRDSLQDDRSIQRMFRAHADAIDDGIAPDSQEYFSYIENRLGIRNNDPADGPMSSASKRAVPPPPAPASRAAPSRPGTLRLTAAQAETARDLGIEPEEYAKNLVTLKREGRM